MKKSINLFPLYMGRPVFASVNWEVTSLSHLAKFFVDSCDVHFHNDMSFRLVDQNCYSKTFGTKQLQSEKVVSTTSNFRFRSFIVGRGSRTMKMKLSCSIKVCTVKDGNCNDGLTATDDRCPQTAMFAYQANTYGT